MNVEEVLRARDATGLQICSVCCSTHWGKPLSSPKAEVRAEGLEGIKQSLREAKKYGATSVLVVPGVAKDGVTYQECWDRSIAELRKAIPVAEECGAKIAIENVWNDFLTDPKEALRYLEEINSPWVGWHFDTGNILYYGDPAVWIRTLGKRVIRVHIKEYSLDIAKKQDKWKGFGVKLLEGSNQWPEIMKALDDVGYQSWFITEMPGDQTRDLASLKEFSGRLDKILAS
jgi:hexulose-6-phosphate isomerase